MVEKHLGQNQLRTGDTPSVATLLEGTLTGTPPPIYSGRTREQKGGAWGRGRLPA